MRLRILDRIEIKAEYATRHSPGLVLVIDGGKLIGQPLLGQKVTVGNGAMSHELVVGEAKPTGKNLSLFFEGMTLDKVPVDAEVTIEDGAEGA